MSMPSASPAVLPPDAGTAAAVAHASASAMSAAGEEMEPLPPVSDGVSSDGVCSPPDGSSDGVDVESELSAAEPDASEPDASSKPVSLEEFGLSDSAAFGSADSAPAGGVSVISVRSGQASSAAVSPDSAASRPDIRGSGLGGRRSHAGARLHAQDVYKRQVQRRRGHHP